MAKQIAKKSTRPRPSKKSNKKQKQYTRSPIAKRTRGDPRLSHYLRYINHEHFEVDKLRPPSDHARRIARWHSWGRVIVQSAADVSVDTLTCILNPSRWCEGTVYKGSEAGQAFAACEIGNLNSANRLLPNSGWGTVFNPAEGYYPTGSATFGNRFGERRWVGATFTIRYLGTALNAGGEITLVHDDTSGGCPGGTANTLRAHPRARRFAIPPNGNPVTINMVSTGAGIHFIDMPQFNTAGGGFDDTKLPGDIRTYGIGAITTGAAKPEFGRGDVPLGWNVALMINSAANSQRFEVTLDIAYEGQLASVMDGSLSAQRVQAIPITDTAHADPQGAALVETVTHSQTLVGPNTNRPSSTFKHVVESAASSLAPLAGRLALGYANSVISSLGY